MANSPARAPTSTPTVGESRISSFGSVASHLASTMRCWLPPDSVETASSGLPILTVSSPIQWLTRSDFLRVEIRSTTVDDPAEHGKHDVVGDRLRLDEAERQPVLRDIGDAGLDRVAVRAEGDRLAVEADGAAVGSGHAEQAEAEFGPAGADQPGEPDHLAGMDREVDVLDTRRAARGRRPRAPAARRSESRLTTALSKVLPVISSVRRDLRHVGGVVDPDLPAVAEHGHPRRDLEHLRQPVADEDHRHAVGGKLRHDREQAVGLGMGEDAVGSSMKINRASPTSVRQMATIWRSAIDRVLSGASRSSVTPSRASTRFAFSRITRRLTSRGRVPRMSLKAIFSATVICGNSARSCQMTLMPKAPAVTGVTDFDVAAEIVHLGAGVGV